MGERKTFVLKFKGVPKSFKKYVKENYQIKKFYDPKEANLIYADAVKNTGVTGSMIVVMKCLASGKSVCDAEIEIDPKLALDVTLMNRVERDMRAQGYSLEEMDILLDDFKFAFGWHEQQELRQRLDKATTKLKDVESASVKPDEGQPENEGEIALDMSEELYELESLNDLVAQDDDWEREDDINIAVDEANDDLLDVSTLESVSELERKVLEQKGKLKNPMDHLVDVFDLTGDLDFVSVKKKAFIEANYTQEATTFLKGLYNLYSSKLKRIKKQAKEELDSKYREVQSENYTELEAQVDKVKQGLQKKFDQKKESEIANIEKNIKEELDAALYFQRSSIEKELFLNLTDEQKAQLITCRESVENGIKSDIDKLIEQNDAKYEKFIDGIRSKLQIKQFDFEREHNNLEMQRMRQEVLEEQKQFQRLMLEMQQQQKNVVDIGKSDEEKKSGLVLVIILVFLALIGGGVLFFSLDFVQEVMLGFLQ